MDIYKKAKELIEMLKDADFDEIEIKDGLREIRLTKRAAGFANAPMSVMSQPMPAMQAAAPALSPEETSAEKKLPDDVTEFKSPMVGTFYRAPSPEAQAYVTEGERVTPDATLCIIEAMKVMNEIKAESSGEVVDILVENGEAVEFGQPLFLIKSKK
jgi:acetyl-CoA carboxylase biotin carboxyl carrier protein